MTNNKNIGIKTDEHGKLKPALLQKIIRSVQQSKLNKKTNFSTDRKDIPRR